MPMKWSVEFITGSSNPTIANTTASSTTVTIPGDGTYHFKYEIDAQTITPDCMTNSFYIFAPQYVNVYTSQAGSIALAGADQRFCNGSGAGNLAATSFTVGTGKWEVYKVVSGVAPVLADVASPATGIQFTQAGQSILRGISYGTSATCGESSSDQVTISWIPPANAGADQAPCNASATTLNGAVVAPGTGACSQLSGSTATTSININDPKTPVSNLANGNYVFHFTATDGLGCTSGDDVSIVINNVTAVPDAGSNGVICSGGNNKIRLAAAPATTGLTGTWTIANMPAGAPVGTFSSSASQADAIYDGVTTPGNYTFKWTLSNGTCIASDFVQYTANSTGCTLPVTLISFIAVKKGTATLLDWLEADEVNFSHYDVERSANGINFKNLESLPSASISKKYQYTDVASERGINYYRLKMIDMDGFVRYSNIQSLNFTDGSFKIYLQPNPTHANITITDVKAGYTIRIISMDGKLITEKLCTGNIIQLNIMALSAGVYTAQILDGNATVRNIKFFKE